LADAEDRADSPGPESGAYTEGAGLDTTAEKAAMESTIPTRVVRERAKSLVMA